MPQANRLKLPSVPARQQLANRAIWNDSRSATEADFFTVGYAGRSAEELLDLLIINNVQTLVDIRQYAVSMYRPELSKSNLGRFVRSKGLSYVHWPELGVPRDIRAKAIGAGTRDVIWEWYDKYVVEGWLGRNLHRFLNSIEHPAAFMCVEIDPRECHRHRIFLALEEMGLSGFEI